MNKKTNYVVVIIVITFVVLLLAVYFLVFKKTDEPINVDATKVDTIEQGGEVQTSNSGETFLPVIEKDVKELAFYELNNYMYEPGGGDNIKGKIEILKASDSYENKQKATFLESFVGDYENALKDREEYCKDAPENDSYCLKFKLTLNSYYPKDSEGNYLQGTRMYVDGRDIGAWAGNKEIEVENQFIHRIAIEKEGYLDYFGKYPISSVGNLQESFNPKLVKANSGTIIKSSEETTLYTNNFDFIIKPNTFVDANGKVYNGDIKIYLFDLGSENNNENVFNLDVFTSDNLSFVGTSMVTFGMPYLTIYDTKGNRLYIGSEIIGRGQIQNTEKAPNIDLKNVPKNVYLGKAELEEYGIPPFWNLDLKNGVWKESKMKILDNGGNYEFIYN